MELRFRWQKDAAALVHVPYTFGTRNGEACQELLALLTPFSISMITSDDCATMPEKSRRST